MKQYDSGFIDKLHRYKDRVEDRQYRSVDLRKKVESGFGERGRYNYTHRNFNSDDNYINNVKSYIDRPAR